MDAATPPDALDCSLAALQRRYVDLQIESQKISEEIGRLEKQRSQVNDDADDLLQTIRQISEGEEADVEVTEVDGVVTAEPSTAPAANPVSWRDVPISMLKLSSIKGMGKRKRTLLIDEVPTLGKLQELREQASKEFVLLCSVLPKGIGVDIADELEELFINWLVANDGSYGIDETAPKKCDIPRKMEPLTPPTLALAPPPVIEPFNPPEVLKAADELVRVAERPAGVETFDVVPLSIDVSEVAIDLPTDTPEYLAERVTYWKQRAASNENHFDIGSIDIADRDAFNSGRDAAHRGWIIEDCPWTPGDKQDSWILGYLAGSKPSESDVDSANPAGRSESDNDSLFRLTI